MMVDVITTQNYYQRARSRLGTGPMHLVVVAPNDGGGKQLTNLEGAQDWRFPRLRHLQFLSHCCV